MHRSPRLLLATGLTVAVMLPVAGMPNQKTHPKPLLSNAVRAALEKEGPEAAERRFAEIYPDRKDEYEIDAERLMELAMEYAKRGDQEKSQAVIRIWMKASEAVHLGDTATSDQERESRKPERAGEPEPVNPGPSRKDLSRFYGVYGDPQGQKPTAPKFFVTGSCDGRVQFGAMWGDVAPWIMRSESDAVFVQAWRPEYEKVHAPGIRTRGRRQSPGGQAQHRLEKGRPAHPPGRSAGVVREA